MAKKLKTVVFIVSYEDGMRVERNYDNFTLPERVELSKSLTDSFMDGIGYAGRKEKTAV
ncbi:MAG: hypothetical protein PHP79_06125 [Clostridia bacterium]|nr:hypothetical protein [Clostridia bacterium]